MSIAAECGESETALAAATAFEASTSFIARSSWDPPAGAAPVATDGDGRGRSGRCLRHGLRRGASADLAGAIGPPIAAAAQAEAGQRGQRDERGQATNAA